ncbi:TPA: FliM/FliN family flagellar motor switch protein [Pseudomonas aeruginosa]|nr:FliM/FliN family flagellar motor switch protein [Pseudomonas aeruginosa]HBO1471925.1 FliM/FliN family flagellar motor switch protein [Pseudomonas aeruginosa]HBO7099529.1 hypothetical protein [Pseudomonas aeruginosa]HBP5204598.1 hypothetical protein [Pseudomonas aeruginosa]HCF5279435.1 FliM/FliN family flagellar motor switch protein [Pseudomonas aeruginosa]
MLEASGPDALPVLPPELCQAALAHEERAVLHEHGAAGVAHDEVGVFVDRLVRAVVLDRLAGEPLDVLVNGTLIAHGEVVVVNEKFGIRLTDVISPSERIKKLR